jgi:hypothetical protein
MTNEPVALVKGVYAGFSVVEPLGNYLLPAGMALYAKPMINERANDLLKLALESLKQAYFLDTAKGIATIDAIEDYLKEINHAQTR